ncbi:O-antigen ligase family protein [Vibrio sp. TH_r3]|uniref:O-antigen ligase family protein n=1 Tax=Vibrio sp. TH_r3 TaxID=3082084 RepID=UPI0029548ECE|nr:O-antigen ligase family protein [Vibrio sp. TH_r3]MDV7102869.1 O-antigen ligase family protein [Vibrio sp. TH_r3]
MTKIEIVCFYSFLLLVIWLPIPLASNRVWAWSIFEVWIALQTLALIFSLRTHFPWQRLKRFLWLLLPLILFQVWIAIQIIPLPDALLNVISPSAFRIYSFLNLESKTISLDWFATVSGLLKGVAYTLFTFNAIILINSIKRIKQVILAVVFSGTLQAFYAALMILTASTQSWVFGLPQGSRATGSFVYHNHLANYLIMTLSLGIGLIVSQMHQSESGSWQVRFRRWFEAILSPKMIIRLCLVVMVIALVMTRSRMGNTAFFSITIIGGLVALFFYKNKPRALTALVISFLIIDTLAVGTIFGLDKVKERLENTAMNTETRDQAVLWSMDIIKDYPLTGTGLGSFYSTFPSYSQYNIGYYDFTHNDYIQFAAEVGIPAVLVLGCMVLIGLWFSFNAMRTRNSRILKGTALGCFMAIIGMLIHITVDFNLQAPANAVTFLLVLVLAGCTRVIKNTVVSKPIQ